MFKIPTTGGSRERAAGTSTREKVQLAVMVAMLIVIVGWWASRSARRAAQRPPELAYRIEDMAEDAAADMAEQERISRLRRDEVLELKEADERRAAAGSEAPPEEAVEPALAPWNWGGADEIPLEEHRALVEDERAEEAERASFMPMSEQFKPLEPDAVRVYRAKIVDRVPGRGKPVFVLPAEPGAEYEVQEADGEGMTVRRAGGDERRFTWDEMPVESLHAIGKQVSPTEGPLASEKDAVFLAQLATLAGKPDEAEAHRKKAAELDPELAGRLPREPTTSVDYRILDLYSWSFDNPMRPTPREATSVREDAPSIFMVYRYLRTVGPEKLAEAVQPPTRYERLQGLPVNYRGRVYSVKGRFIRRYKSTRWTRVPGHEEAGIQDLDFCYVRGAKWSGIYLVSVPQDTRVFGSSDMVRFTGVYVRRWPYRTGPGEWSWIPWIASLDMEKVAIAPSTGIRIVGIGILAAAVVGVVLVFLYARHDSREALKSRELRTARQRAQRDRIRRKVAEATASAKASGGEAGKDAAGEAATKAKSGEKPDDKPDDKPGEGSRSDAGDGPDRESAETK